MINFYLLYFGFSVPPLFKLIAIKGIETNSVT